MHEELSHPERLRCTCGPCSCSDAECTRLHLRLRSEHGELVTPRGKSVNKCAYCARLAAVENCEMLALDALEGDPPAVLVILGTRTATVDMERFYDALRLVKRAIRRRCPDAEYASLLEYTTGHAERSGGSRRPHWNLLFKGVPVDAWSVWWVRHTAARVWCEHVDAAPQAQYAEAVGSGEALMKYLSLHFQKSSQQPPAAFRGQRFNCSRGYFTGCSRATARARAKDSLAFKRQLFKQIRVRADDAFIDAHEVELDAQLAHRQACSTRWVLAGPLGTPLQKDGPMAVPDADIDWLARHAAGWGEQPPPRTLGARVRQAVGRQHADAAEVLDEQLSGRWLPARDLELFTLHDVELMARAATR